VPPSGKQMRRFISRFIGLRCPHCKAPLPLGRLTTAEPSTCERCNSKIVVAHRYDRVFIAFCILLGFAMHPFEWPKLWAALFLVFIALRLLCAVQYKVAGE
jgi:uncharacterized paraquat-inducible protein A